jgi:hypothetical protein
MPSGHPGPPLRATAWRAQVGTTGWLLRSVVQALNDRLGALPAVPSGNCPWVSRNGSTDDRRRAIVYNGIVDAFRCPRQYPIPAPLGLCRNILHVSSARLSAFYVAWQRVSVSLCRRLAGIWTVSVACRDMQKVDGYQKARRKRSRHNYVDGTIWRLVTRLLGLPPCW